MRSSRPTTPQSAEATRIRSPARRARLGGEAPEVEVLEEHAGVDLRGRRRRRLRSVALRSSSRVRPGPMPSRARPFFALPRPRRSTTPSRRSRCGRSAGWASAPSSSGGPAPWRRTCPRRAGGGRARRRAYPPWSDRSVWVLERNHPEARRETRLSGSVSEEYAQWPFPASNVSSPPASSSSARAAPGCGRRSRSPSAVCRCSSWPSARARTRTPCSPRAASTRRSARWTPRTRPRSTPPTRSPRATGSATRGSSSSSSRARRRRSTSSSSGARASHREDDGELSQRFFGAHTLAADVLRRRLHGPRDPDGARRAAPRSCPSTSTTAWSSPGCSRPTAASSAPTASTSRPARRTSSTPMPSSSPPAGTRGSTGAPPRAATRTSARACASPCRPAGGCRTWSSSSSTRPGWSRPRTPPGRSSPRRSAARAASCATRTASASWSATTPSGGSSPPATASRWRTTRRSTRAAAPRTAA